MGKTKTLAQRISECRKAEKHSPICQIVDSMNLGYSKCPHIGEIVHVPIYKSGAIGHMIRYKCKLSEEETSSYLRENGS